LFYYIDDVKYDLMHYNIFNKSLERSDYFDMLSIARLYKTSHVIMYNEFMYQAGSWTYTRKRCVKLKNRQLRWCIRTRLSWQI